MKVGPDQMLWHGIGCSDCHQTGYRGRTGIHELFLVDDTVRQLIHDGTGEQEIEQEVRKHSLSIQMDGFQKVINGATTIEEVMRVTRE